MLWEMDVKKMLQEKGYDIKVDFLILETCSPEHAKRMLDQRIKAGYLLPCRIAIYKKMVKCGSGCSGSVSRSRMFDKAASAGTANEIETSLKKNISKAV